MNPSLNDFNALVAYLKQCDTKAIIVEGIRGCGKTTLLGKLSKALAVDHPDGDEPYNLPIYQTFGSRKGLALADSQIDLPTTSFMVLDVIRQLGMLCPVLIDRNYISTMVFNGWTHGRLTLARRLWAELRAVHIIVNVCRDQFISIVEKRTDITVTDLAREEELFMSSWQRALDGLPTVHYWNLELCGHTGDVRQSHCVSLGSGFDNAKFGVKQS